MTGGDAELTAADLPAAVRNRLVALVAACLPQVPQLPASLRRVADFAPSRRAKVGASAIVGALADDELRERIAVQAQDQARPGADEPREPAEAAALAWLTRPEGWEQTYADAVADLERRREPEDRDPARVGRLEEQVRQAEQALRDARAGHRTQVTELKAEISELRRKLGEARTADREARATAEQAQAAAEQARVSTEERLAAQERELRQLRAQVARSEESSGAERRAARSERDEATVRARLLLETIVSSATGLQRELALPPTTGSPADRFTEQVAGEGAREPTGSRALDSADPALLKQYLALPRAHLVVDGYNVSKQAWESSSLEVQRSRLLSGLAALVARTRTETTVVFDAAATTTRPVVTTPRGVRVLFSPPGTIADDVIRDLVAAEPEGRVVVVVTDDRAVLADVARSGARTAGSRSLVDLMRT